MCEENKDVSIVVQEMSDAFSIVIDDVVYNFDQEDTKENLIEVFRALGYTNVEYEEVY